MALADQKVGWVVSRGYFENAGAELQVDVIVPDYGDATLLFGKFGWKGAKDMLSNEGRVTRIFRIHRNGCVTRDCLRSSGGDGEKSTGFANNGNSKMIEQPPLLFHDDFLVGKGSA
jgi:hypothetical protein